MSELFNAVVTVFGNALTVWALFAFLMIIGFLVGRLSGGFKAMGLMYLSFTLLIIGALSSAVSARFADTGVSVLVGLSACGLMLAAFMVGAAFAPHRSGRATTTDVGPWNPTSGRFTMASSYDEQGRPRD